MEVAHFQGNVWHLLFVCCVKRKFPQNNFLKRIWIFSDVLHTAFYQQFFLEGWREGEVNAKEVIATNAFYCTPCT